MTIKEQYTRSVSLFSLDISWYHIPDDATAQCSSEAPRAWRQAAAKAVIQTLLLGIVENWAHPYWILSRLYQKDKRVIPSSSGAYAFVLPAVVVSKAYEQTSGDTSVVRFSTRTVEILSNIRQQKSLCTACGVTYSVIVADGDDTIGKGQVEMSCCERQ